MCLPCVKLFRNHGEKKNDAKRLTFRVPEARQRSINFLYKAPRTLPVSAPLLIRIRCIPCDFGISTKNARLRIRCLLCVFRISPKMVVRSVYTHSATTCSIYAPAYVFLGFLDQHGRMGVPHACISFESTVSCYSSAFAHYDRYRCGRVWNE